MATLRHLWWWAAAVGGLSACSLNHGGLDPDAGLGPNDAAGRADVVVATDGGAGGRGAGGGQGVSASSGGTVGSGGAIATTGGRDGMLGNGGAADTGGAPASGGSLGGGGSGIVDGPTGGDSGAGAGAPGSGGGVVVASGGNTASGGAVGSGGRLGVAGALGTGGRAERGSGGAPGTGGRPPCTSYPGAHAFLPPNDDRSHCYWFREQRETWPAARALCVGEGGDLASILSKAENDFVVSVARFSQAAPEFWIGGTDTRPGNDRSGPGAYRWVTNEAWGYANWSTMSPAQPDGFCDSCDNGQPCTCDHRATLAANGTWFDFWQDNRRGFLCEVTP